MNNKLSNRRQIVLSLFRSYLAASEAGARLTNEITFGALGLFVKMDPDFAEVVASMRAGAESGIICARSFYEEVVANLLDPRVSFTQWCKDTGKSLEIAQQMMLDDQLAAFQVGRDENISAEMAH